MDDIGFDDLSVDLTISIELPSAAGPRIVLKPDVLKPSSSKEPLIYPRTLKRGSWYLKTSYFVLQMRPLIVYKFPGGLQTESGLKLPKARQFRREECQIELFILETFCD